jgi:glycerate 2-kinase
VRFLGCKEKLLGNIKELVHFVINESDLKRRVAERLRANSSPLQINKGIVVIAMGKGAASMAEGAIEVLGDKVLGGVVALPHNVKADKGRLSPLEVMEGGHPLPDESSLRAADAVIEWAKNSRNAGGLLALISGGGSAVVEKPLEPLTLDDIIVTNKELLNCGASIREVNTVRKHLSAIKGGRLASIAYPSPILGLYASDVPGDKLEDIASGPTVPDSTTYKDAISVLELYDIKDRVPKSVIELLERGVKGEIEETPKPGSPIFRNVRNDLIARNLDVLNSIERLLKNKGYNVLKLTSRLEGESKEVAKVLASIALESLKEGVPLSPPLALVLGGETSVTVRGSGRGGRNQELVVAWANRMYYWEGGLENTAILAVDTDGIDGVTDAAGAYMFPSDIATAKSLNLDPNDYLRNNDTYNFLKKLDRLIVTGPTGSNLNSVIVVLIDKC